MQLILEPRFLFDGSVGAVARPVAHGLHHAFGIDGDTHAGQASHIQEPGSHATAHAGPAYDVPAIAPNPAATTLLFVDPRVTGWQSLAASVTSNVQVIVLNPNRDAIDQVTRALNGRSGITAIDFLAYGTAGSVEIGNTPLTAATVSSHASEIAGWSDHLAANADILFYSCDVAQGATGQALLADLHTLTGAQVAAATDAVGSAALGGTWTLNSETGVIDAAIPFSAAAVAAYTGVLDTPIATVTITGSQTPGTATGTGTASVSTSGTIETTTQTIGNTFIQTVTLTNSDTTASSGQPFIEVFAPANATESATLSSLTGGTIKQTVSLTTNANGQVVGIDTFNNNVTVLAPSGFVAGDKMYVVELSNSSLAAGASASVALTFASTTANGMTIAALGGFQTGGSAPILGTSLAEATTASPTTFPTGNSNDTPADFASASNTLTNPTTTIAGTINLAQFNSNGSLDTLTGATVSAVGYYAGTYIYTATGTNTILLKNGNGATDNIFLGAAGATLPANPTVAGSLLHAQPTTVHGFGRHDHYRSEWRHRILRDQFIPSHGGCDHLRPCCLRRYRNCPASGSEPRAARYEHRL